MTLYDTQVIERQLGPLFAHPFRMQSVSFSRVRKKATWGARVVSASSGLATVSVRALLVALVISFALPLSASAASSSGNSGSNKGKSGKSADLVDPAERKLDPQVRDRSRHKANEESDVIVEFRDDKDYLDVLRGFGKAGRRLSGMNGRALRLNNGLLKRLAEDSKVKRISLDRDVAGSNGRTSVTVGGIAVNYLMGLKGNGVGVAVIDSGIVNWHDDLTVANRQGQRVVHFKDFVNGLTQKYDDWGHGTHVAGIIAGNGYDSYGVRPGIAPGANIIALKALNATGSGRISNIIAAVDYAISIKNTYNIRVINMSLGAGVFESYNTDPLTLAAKRAVDAGIVVVASAGNMGKALDGSPQYGAITAPANAPWVLTVGASSTEGTIDRRDDKIANYSSRGPTMIDFAAKPDLVAPGSGTVSLSAPQSSMYLAKAPYLIGALNPSLGLTYKPYLTLSGTSMAAPVVAGTVALMVQANPNLTPNMVKAILQYTAQVYPTHNWLTQGAGFLNTRGAVLLAQYFATGHAGVPYPKMIGWSKHIFWGNFRVVGGVLTPGGTAWGGDVTWGSKRTPAGLNIVWGENCDTNGTCENDNIVWGNNLVWGEQCDTEGCDNIVWGNTDADNLVWGNSDGVDNIDWGNGETNNIVWGNNDGDNIVWGNDCEGANCDNIVWGNVGEDSIVWGNAEGIDNIVWGNNDLDNIVWGNSSEDNISWGNAADEELVFFGDDEADVTSFDPTVWDDLFEMAVPVTPDPTPPPTEPPPPVEEPVTTTTTTVLSTITTNLEGGVL